MFSNKSLHVIEKLIISVNAYDFLLPTYIEELKIFLHKIKG